MVAKDLFADDVADVFLDTGVFAESFTVLFKTGGTRTITAAVANESVETDERSHDKRQREILEILIKHDATDGLDADPVPGDRLQRDDETPPRVTYQFDAVLERDPAARLIRYTRPKQTRAGHSSSIR